MRNHRGTLLFLLIGFSIAAIPLLSQSPSGQRPSFEVASIKPSPSDPTILRMACHGTDGGPTTIPLGRCIVDGYPLKIIAEWAYGVQHAAVTGGPDWVASERFDIIGKAEDPSTFTKEQGMKMVQTLLTDRFKLAFHRETRPGDGYILSVKDRNKGLTEAEPSEQSLFSTGRKAGQILKVTAQNVSVERLMLFISDRLHVPILDRSGIERKVRSDVGMDARCCRDASPIAA